MTYGETAAWSAAEATRLRQLCVRAEVRYLRRKWAVDWFWWWCRKKWQEQPHLWSKVTPSVAHTVPALSTSPVRHTHVCYEDCVALQDEAFMLLNRLLLRQKRGGQVDITQSEDQYLHGTEERDRQEPFVR